MAISDQLTRTRSYVDTLFDDDEVREQLGEALVRARRAVRRARAQKATQAVRDKTLLEHVTASLASFQAAVRGLTGRPQPAPPRRRRSRTVVLFALALAAGGVAAKASKPQRAAPGDDATA
jgi:hypothetical protein